MKSKQVLRKTSEKKGEKTVEKERESSNRTFKEVGCG